MTTPKPDLSDLTLDELVEFAHDLVNIHRGPTSDDSWDYYTAACNSLADLAGMQRDFLGDDHPEALDEWLNLPPDEWSACDGDVRWQLAAFLADNDNPDTQRALDYDAWLEGWLETQ